MWGSRVDADGVLECPVTKRDVLESLEEHMVDGEDLKLTFAERLQLLTNKDKMEYLRELLASRKRLG